MKLPLTGFGVLLFVVSIAGISCSRGGGVAAPDNDTAATAAESATAFQASKVGRGMIWADCELFETVGTPTDFDPPHGPFDRLFHGTFKDGIGAISESKPGDQDYNGGRWEVWDPKPDVDLPDFSSACKFEDLGKEFESFFEPTGTYFECPLLPRRGHNLDD
jgi:hypothetical protein